MALYTTVYPGVERFLSAWYGSVVEQTDQEFDLWIAVDSLNVKDIDNLLGEPHTPRKFIEGNSGSPAQIKAAAMSQLADEYKAIIFVDSDDILYPQRVEMARKLLENSEVVGCTLDIIDESGNDLGIRFGETHRESLESLLPRYNIFGLSNTAYRSDIIKKCLPLARDCELIDWLLATRAWAMGARMFFDEEPQMAYRQYSSNVARVLPPFTEKQVQIATKRVLGHDRCLLETRAPINGAKGEALRREHQRRSEFHRAITRSPKILTDYVESLNQMPPRYVWWWCVAHPELEQIWKN